MSETNRRDFLLLSGAAGLSFVAGCAGVRARPDGWTWRPAESALLAAVRDDFDVVTRGSASTRILRTRAREVPAGLDLSAVERRMERAMNRAEGVGLAGPQVGLLLRVACLMLDYKTDHPRTVFVRNPVIVERSDDSIEGYEGCLSIPGVGGLVRRNDWIRVEHTSVGGEIVSCEAEGPNAVPWQHEIDHLDGVLYVDKVLGELLPMEEVRRLREQAEPADVSRGPSGEHLEGSLWLVA